MKPLGKFIRVSGRFFVGATATFLIAYGLLSWFVTPTLPPEDPGDADVVSMARMEHELGIACLSAIVGAVGGIGCAAWAARK